MDKILVLGAGGQIGTELCDALNKKYGLENVIISDINESAGDRLPGNEFRKIDVTDLEAIEQAIKDFGITQIYHMAALLSATSEKMPQKAWEININSLIAVLELAKEYKLAKIFWPSSIAAFGYTTPKNNTPQHTIMEPNTVYGISKYAGELWCQYYFQKFGVDVRSIRYPGIISWKTKPGGGTTDYAVEIYHEAIEKGKYTCFLAADRDLPMMYMPDAVRATVGIMDADASKLSTRMSYNIASMTFGPAEIADSIRRVIPDFQIDYELDFRDELAQSWPNSIDDSLAQKDWNWKAEYDLDRMTEDMIFHLKKTPV